MSSPLSQCIGPEFDSLPPGELVLRLAGTPAGAALPASGNGLRVDPDKGAWAPAEHTCLEIAKSREDRPGGATVYPGARRVSGLLTYTITNPSASRSMLCFIQVEASLEFKIPEADGTNAGYTGWALVLGWDADADATKAVHTPDAVTRRDMGVDHEASIIQQAAATGHIVLPPGESVDLRAQTGLRVFDFGYGKYVYSYLAVRGIGVTL